MKKFFTSVFAFFVVFSFAACSNTEVPDSSSSTTTTGTTTTVMSTTDKPVITPSEMSSSSTSETVPVVTDEVGNEQTTTTMITTTTTALYSDSNSSSSVVTTVPVNTEVIVTGTTTNGYVPIITTTGETGYVPSTSLTQGTTTKVTTTASSGTTSTTTKKPATVTTTTTKKTTTKTTTTTKKTTTTAKTTTKTTTTTKSTTTSASYVPFKKPVSFVYDKNNNVYRATMSSTLTIAWKESLYGQLIIYRDADLDSDEFKTPYSTDEYPVELTLKGKTSNGKFYYATAVWGSSRRTYSGYIPVNTKAFIDVYFDYDAAYDIFREINKERVKAGVEPLQYDYNLEKYAMFRSSELYIKFDHYSPSSTAAESTKKRQEYVVPYHSSHTENIYQLRCDGLWTDYTLPTAAEINKEWVNSSGHYASMICDEWKYVGVGVYRCEKGTFAVQYYGNGSKM